MNRLGLFGREFLGKMKEDNSDQTFQIYLKSLSENFQRIMKDRVIQFDKDILKVEKETWEWIKDVNSFNPNTILYKETIRDYLNVLRQMRDLHLYATEIDFSKGTVEDNENIIKLFTEEFDKLEKSMTAVGKIAEDFFTDQNFIYEVREDVSKILGYEE